MRVPRNDDAPRAMQRTHRHLSLAALGALALSLGGCVTHHAISAESGGRVYLLSSRSFAGILPTQTVRECDVEGDRISCRELQIVDRAAQPADPFATKVAATVKRAAEEPQPSKEIEEPAPIATVEEPTPAPSPAPRATVARRTPVAAPAATVAVAKPEPSPAPSATVAVAKPAAAPAPSATVAAAEPEPKCAHVPAVSSFVRVRDGATCKPRGGARKTAFAAREVLEVMAEPVEKTGLVNVIDVDGRRANIACDCLDAM